MLDNSKKESRRRRLIEWHPVDFVALLLSAALGLTVLLILIVSAIQITQGRIPEVMLSENATQVLIAGIGGMVGLLGAYIGINRDRKSRQNSDDEKEA
jgi:hypothetical protein